MFVLKLVCMRNGSTSACARLTKTVQRIPFFFRVILQNQNQQQLLCIFMHAFNK